MLSEQKSRSKNTFIKSLMFQMIPLFVAISGIWIIGVQRSVVGQFDQGKLATPISVSFPHESMWELHIPENSAVPLCPGADCPLSPKLHSESDAARSATGWQRSSQWMYDRATAASFKGTYFVRIDTSLPAFATEKNRLLAFDLLGIAGKSWRLFVNGVEQAQGRGGTFEREIPFKSDGGNAGDPLTIGFEVKVARSFAPGIFTNSVAFISPLEVAPTIRAAYRGVEKERILPEAYARMILAVVAALGCLFTPFHLEILAYSLGASLWNYSSLSTSNMIAVPWFLNVDFVTIDVAVRCGLYASINSFLALFFRQKKIYTKVPLLAFVGLGGYCLIAGRLGWNTMVTPLVEHLHYFTLGVLLTAGVVYAVRTWRVTRNLPHAKFRRRVALIFAVLLAANSALQFLHQATIWKIVTDSFLSSNGFYVLSSKYAELVMLCFGVTIALEWALVVRDRQKVLQRFGMVVDPRVLKEIITSPRIPAVRSDQVISLFVDLRSFTTMCEVFSAPEVTRALNEYLDVITTAVQEHNGVVDKFAGDSVLALWGVPVASNADPMDGVRAALAIRKGIHELNAVRQERGEFILAYGIGIHLGPAIFGPIGNRQRIDFTAIGPTINLSARLQSASKDQGVDIVISQALHAYVAHRVLCVDIGLISIRGLSKDVHVLHLLGVQNDEGQMMFHDKILEAGIRESNPGLIAAAPSNLIRVSYEKDEREFQGAA